MSLRHRRLVLAAVALSLVHHLDHVLRGAVGWPFADAANPFTWSLAIYPVVALGLVLTARGRLGARFWTVLPAGGALFLLAIHVGPVADDAVGDIPGTYAAPAAGVAAVVLLLLLVAVLVAAALEARRGAAADPALRG